MKTSYDPDTDALYLLLAETSVVGSEEVAPGIILDFDAEHRLVGIEVLNASTNAARGAIPAAAE